MNCKDIRNYSFSHRICGGVEAVLLLCGHPRLEKLTLFAVSCGDPGLEKLTLLAVLCGHPRL